MPIFPKSRMAEFGKIMVLRYEANKELNCPMSQRNEEIFREMMAGGMQREIAEKHGVSKERVRQIAHKAMRIAVGRNYSDPIYIYMARGVDEVPDLQEMLFEAEQKIQHLELNLAIALAHVRGETDQPLPESPRPLHEIMNVSVRLLNVLKWENIDTVADLNALSYEEMMRFPNFGKKCMEEVNAWLIANGLEPKAPRRK